MNGLVGAVQFLTRIPVATTSPAPHHRVIPWFPVVGSVIGAVVGIVGSVSWSLLAPLVAASLAVGVGLLVTGAFHEDGLADVADAFGGGWTVEERLAILDDSRHGTYGVAALATSIVVRVACLASMPTAAGFFVAAVCAHTLGRCAAVTALWWAPSAVDGGLGADAAAALRRGPVSAGLAAGLAVTVGLSGWWAGALVLTAATGTWATVILAVRKIGGVAGDVLGAVEQVVECLVLVVASGLGIRYQVWWQ